MQARFAGTCRDCGNRFPAGTDIDWQRGQGASCGNGTQYPSPGAEFSPGIEERQAGLPDPRPQAAKADRAFIVDGAMKMEWVAEKTYQEAVGFQGDTVIYEERVYSGYNWMCFECKLVWDKQHQAKNCGKRGHVTTYEDTYGVREVENGVPKGNNMYSITRTAIRREKSPDTPPVAPAPVPQVEEPTRLIGLLCLDCGSESGKKCLADCSTQVDMTSEQLWDSIPTANHPTITTTWN